MWCQVVKRYNNLTFRVNFLSPNLNLSIFFSLNNSVLAAFFCYSKSCPRAVLEVMIFYTPHIFLLRLLWYPIVKSKLVVVTQPLPVSHDQKYSRPRCLLCVKGLVICFYLGWSCSILQFRQNIIKVGSKSLLLTCSSNKLWAYLYYIFLIRRES